MSCNTLEANCWLLEWLNAYYALASTALEWQVCLAATA
jgi:hypothetical protein